MGRRDVGSVFFLRNQTFQNSERLKRNENHNNNIFCWNVVEIICMQTHLLFYYKYYTLRTDIANAIDVTMVYKKGQTGTLVQEHRPPVHVIKTLLIPSEYYNEYCKYETTYSKVPVPTCMI